MLPLHGDDLSQLDDILVGERPHGQGFPIGLVQLGGAHTSHLEKLHGYLFS